MRRTAGTLAMLALVACSRPSAPPEAAVPDLSSASAFVDSFLTSLAHPESPAVARFDTAGFVWARSGALLTADSLTSLLQAQRVARKAIVLGTSDAHLTPLGPDVVVWSGIVSGVVRDSTGVERTIRGALTLALRRRGATWVIAAGHESVRPFDDTHEAATAASH